MLGDIRFSVVSSDARKERPGFLMVLLAPQQRLSLGAIRITYLPDGNFLSLLRFSIHKRLLSIGARMRI